MYFNNFRNYLQVYAERFLGYSTERIPNNHVSRVRRLAGMAFPSCPLNSETFDDPLDYAL